MFLTVLVALNGLQTLHTITGYNYKHENTHNMEPNARFSSFHKKKIEFPVRTKIINKQYCASFVIYRLDYAKAKLFCSDCLTKSYTEFNNFG